MISRPLAAASLAVAALLTLALFMNGSGGPGLVPPWDKAAHFGYFFVLTVTLWLGLRGRVLWPVLIVAVAVGAIDEWRQLYLVGRHASAGDFGVDVLAAALALGSVHALARRHGQRAPFPRRCDGGK